jgi:hypothetical protein
MGRGAGSASEFNLSVDVTEGQIDRGHVAHALGPGRSRPRASHFSSLGPSYCNWEQLAVSIKLQSFSYDNRFRSSYPRRNIPPGFFDMVPRRPKTGDGRTQLDDGRTRIRKGAAAHHADQLPGFRRPGTIECCFDTHRAPPAILNGHSCSDVSRVELSTDVRRVSLCGRQRPESAALTSWVNLPAHLVRRSHS